MIAAHMDLHKINVNRWNSVYNFENPDCLKLISFVILNYFSTIISSVIQMVSVVNNYRPTPWDFLKSYETKAITYKWGRINGY